VVYESVQHRLRFYLNQLNCVKMAAISFIFNRGNRKVEWVGDDSHVIVGKKFMVKKEV
jgi:hypothetical protein